METVGVKSIFGKFSVVGDIMQFYDYADIAIKVLRGLCKASYETLNSNFEAILYGLPKRTLEIYNKIENFSVLEKDYRYKMFYFFVHLTLDYNKTKNFAEFYKLHPDMLLKSISLSINPDSVEHLDIIYDLLKESDQASKDPQFLYSILTSMNYVVEGTPTLPKYSTHGKASKSLPENLVNGNRFKIVDLPHGAYDFDIQHQILGVDEKFIKDIDNYEFINENFTKRVQTIQISLCNRTAEAIKILYTSLNLKFPNLENLHINVEFTDVIDLNWIKELLALSYVKKVHFSGMFSLNYSIEFDHKGLSFNVGFELPHKIYSSKITVVRVPDQYSFTKSNNFDERTLDEIFIQTSKHTELVIYEKYVNTITVSDYWKFSHKFIHPRKVLNLDLTKCEDDLQFKQIIAYICNQHSSIVFNLTAYKETPNTEVLGELFTAFLNHPSLGKSIIIDNTLFERFNNGFLEVEPRIQNSIKNITLYNIRKFSEVLNTTIQSGDPSIQWKLNLNLQMLKDDLKLFENILDYEHNNVVLSISPMLNYFSQNPKPTDLYAIRE